MSLFTQMNNCSLWKELHSQDTPVAVCTPDGTTASAVACRCASVICGEPSGRGAFCMDGQCHSTAVVPCGPGTASPDGTVPEGQSECTACAVDTYADHSGATFCNPCADGTTTAGLPAAQSPASCVSECDPGTYRDASTAGRTCTTCLRGQYTDQAELQSCLVCNSDQTTLGDGQTHCVAKCSPGTYRPTPVSLSCRQCEEGQFSSHSEASTCTSCEDGEVTIGTGASAQSACLEACKPGQFRSDSSCQPCDAGRFSTQTESTYCQYCQAGQTTSSEGASKCTAVAAPCPAGSRTDAGTGECTTCESGQYSDVEGADSCVACPAGFAASGESGSFSVACAACPDGQYSDQPAAASCVPCPDGHKSAVGGQFCRPPACPFYTLFFSTATQATCSCGEGGAECEDGQRCHEGTYCAYPVCPFPSFGLSGSEAGEGDKGGEPDSGTSGGNSGNPEPNWPPPDKSGGRRLRRLNDEVMNSLSCANGELSLNAYFQDAECARAPAGSFPMSSTCEVGGDGIWVSTGCASSGNIWFEAFADAQCQTAYEPPSRAEMPLSDFTCLSTDGLQQKQQLLMNQALAVGNGGGGAGGATNGNNGNNNNNDDNGNTNSNDNNGNNNNNDNNEGPATGHGGEDGSSAAGSNNEGSATGSGGEDGSPGAGSNNEGSATGPGGEDGSPGAGSNGPADCPGTDGKSAFNGPGDLCGCGPNMFCERNQLCAFRGGMHLCDQAFGGPESGIRRDDNGCASPATQVCDCAHHDGQQDLCNIGQVCVQGMCVTPTLFPTFESNSGSGGGPRCPTGNSGGAKIQYKLTHRIVLHGVDAAQFNTDSGLQVSFRDAVATTLKIDSTNIVNIRAAGTRRRELPNSSSSSSSSCTVTYDILANDATELDAIGTKVTTRLSCGAACSGSFVQNLQTSMTTNNVQGVEMSQITADSSAPATDSSTGFMGGDDGDSSSRRSRKPKGMSGGEIAAAVLVPLFVLGAVAAGGFVYVRKQRQHSAPSKLNETAEPGAELVMHVNPRKSVQIVNPMEAGAVEMTVSAATAPGAAKTGVSGDAEGQWEMHMDEGSGEVYYVHSATGETSWDAPPGQKWTKHLDENSKQYYFANAETGKVTWTEPGNE